MFDYVTKQLDHCAKMDDIVLIAIGIFVLFLLLCFTIGSLFYVLGISKPIEVGAGAPPIRKAIVAYKFAKGSYKNAGSLFAEVTSIAPNNKPIGIYYDDPNLIPAEKCRYAVGAILSEGEVKADPELVEHFTSEGFKMITLPELSHCVKTSFPFVNSLSILIAVWRVYPALNRYIKEHKLCAYPMLEIYGSSTIEFMAPLSQQEEFFVKEALECVPDEYEHDRDDSLLEDRSARSSPASSRDSRSVSSYSRSYVSSRLGDETYHDDISDSEVEDSTNVTGDNIQDDEVSSSYDVRPSKACTNLLEEIAKQDCSENNTSLMESPDIGATSGDTSGVSLQDSGICSGRTSAIPTETESLTDIRDPAAAEGEDSSSSFEEINIESVLQKDKEE